MNTIQNNWKILENEFTENKIYYLKTPVKSNKLTKSI